MGWIQGFLHPALALGALLASVPLAIHLLNRQRHKPMRWAAMRFVLAAYRRTRRRAQLENLLLLLLRMGAIALLAFALARPFTGGASPLAALTETRRDVVVLVDASASTGYREHVETVFDRELERAREILLSLDGSRGDRARLVLCASFPRLLSWRTPEDALSILATVEEPRDEPFDLAAALGELIRYAEEDGGAASSLEVHLLTDLQRRNFLGRAEPEPGAEEDDAGGGIVELLDRLKALGVHVLVEDLGPAAPTPSNLGVVGIEALGPVPGPDSPVEVSVRVRNFGRTLASRVRVALAVDGQRRPVQTLDVRGREEASAIFPVTFEHAGHHVLEASLEGDGFAVDDALARVIEIPPPVRVLLVDGAPATDVEPDETMFVRAVLEEPGDGAEVGSAFVTRTIPPELLSSESIELADHDVIVLANVESLSARVVQMLEARVASGAGLFVSLGNRTFAQNYNARLWRPDGTGLLPAKLGRVVSVPSRREGYFRVRSFEETHPALEFFADEKWRPLLTEVPIYSFVATAPRDDAKVLATLDDEGANPLLVTRRYDRGRVLLWTTTIDDAWTRLPESPRTLVPLLHETLRWAGRPARQERNLTVGQPLAAEVEHFPRGMTLVRPDGTRRSIEGEPTAVAEGVWRLPPLPEIDAVGLWRVEMEGAETYAFAVGLDPEEGDLERMSLDEVSNLHVALEAHAPGSTRRDADRGAEMQGELWRAFAIACIVFVVLESLWGAWIGYRRRIA